MGQELRRRTGIIRVHVTIRVGTKTSADVMAGKLTSEAINDELAKQGLRAATIVEKAAASEQETANEESGNDLLLVALLSGIGGATVTIIILAQFCTGAGITEGTKSTRRDNNVRGGTVAEATLHNHNFFIR